MTFVKTDTSAWPLSKTLSEVIIKFSHCSNTLRKVQSNFVKYLTVLLESLALKRQSRPTHPKLVILAGLLDISESDPRKNGYFSVVTIKNT